jgi:hypothetical protein
VKGDEALPLGFRQIIGGSVILFTFLDPLPGTGSRSIPGNRTSNAFPIPFLSTGLEGIEATTFTSLLAASKT